MVSTVPGGLETPDFLELRKNTRQETEEPSGPRELYTVIPERETTSRGFMGSSTAYDVGALGKKGSGAPAAGVLGADDGVKKVSRFRSQFVNVLFQANNQCSARLATLIYLLIPMRILLQHNYGPSTRNNARNRIGCMSRVRMWIGVGLRMSFLER
jgi:hypothetical protein